MNSQSISINASVSFRIRISVSINISASISIRINVSINVKISSSIGISISIYIDSAMFIGTRNTLVTYIKPSQYLKLCTVKAVQGAKAQPSHAIAMNIGAIHFEAVALVLLSTPEPHSLRFMFSFRVGI